MAAQAPAAVNAGISILEQGGNAADAAVATLMAASIADYGMFCMGAEVPFMIYDAKKKEVKVLSGLGGAPAGEEAMAWYKEHGIPDDGGAKCIPVPGAMSLFFAALQRHGTLNFATVAKPTLQLLDAGGEGWYDELAATLRKLVSTESNATGTREEKLQAARDRFYKGDIADELTDYYKTAGSFLRKSDLEAHQTLLEDPVRVDYRGYTVNKCSSWTQGPYLCQTLQILEGFDLKSMGHGSPEFIHTVAEALKLGLADRDRYYGDPNFAKVPFDALLSDRYAELRRTLIDPDTASMDIRPGDPLNMEALSGQQGVIRPGPGGTTTCVVADRFGNLVAATPSGNRPYNVCAPLGIAHGNRLRGFNTIDGHPNCIEPGKRPRITLTPTIVTKNGKPVLGISVAMGDLQDQTTLNCLLNVIEFGMEPKEAVTAPRFSTGSHEDSFKPSKVGTAVALGQLTLNKGIPEEQRKMLENKGHQVRVTDGAIAHPVMIQIDPRTGTLKAAGDHRVGRHAAVVSAGKAR